ncbi:MAG: hypothetical protein IPF66_09325 [Holophagales bacterium]|nr:hypothetical protein [Holophagales bacterium]
MPPFGRSILLGLASLFLGTLLITNGWSAPTAAGLLVLLLAVSAVAATPRPAPPLPARHVGRFLAGVVVPAAAIALPALLLTLPFWTTFSPPPRNVGWEAGPFFAPLPFGLVHGLALVLLVPFLFLLYSRPAEGSDGPRRWTALGAWGTTALLALSLVDLAALLHGRLAPAPSIRVFVFGLAAVGLVLAFGDRLPPQERSAPALAAFAFLVLGGCELVYVWDRMNTVFKFGLEATLLLAVAGAAAVDQLVSRSRQPRAARLAWRAPPESSRSPRSRPRRWPSWVTSARDASRRRAERSTGWPTSRPTVPKSPPPSPGSRRTSRAFRRSPRPTAPPTRSTPASRRTRACRRSSAATTTSSSEASRARRSTGGSPTPTCSIPPERMRPAVLSTYGTRFVVSGREERGAMGQDGALGRLPDLLQPVFTHPGLTLYRVLLGPRLNSATSRLASIATAVVFEPQSETAAPSEPRGIASAPDGRVWVADFGNDRVVRFERDLRSPVAFGSKGTGKLEFQQPSAIAVGAEGRIYVADTWNSRIQVLSPEGVYISELTAELYGPRGVATDAKGRVFVSDTGEAASSGSGSTGGWRRVGELGAGADAAQRPDGDLRRCGRHGLGLRQRQRQAVPVRPRRPPSLLRPGPGLADGGPLGAPRGGGRRRQRLGLRTPRRRGADALAGRGAADEAPDSRYGGRRGEVHGPHLRSGRDENPGGRARRSALLAETPAEGRTIVSRETLGGRDATSRPPRPRRDDEPYLSSFHQMGRNVVPVPNAALSSMP